MAVRDLRVAMRGPKAFHSLLGYGAAAAIPVIAAMAIISHYGYATTIENEIPGGLGRFLFAVMMTFLLTMALFIMPVRVAISMSLERETGTMDMLAMSRLSRFDVVTGKLLGTIAFMGLAMVTSLPVAIMCMLMGGLAPEDIAYCYLILTTMTAWVCGIALLVTGLCQHTIGAVAITYAVIMFWSLYLPFALGFAQVTPLIVSLLFLLGLVLVAPYRVATSLMRASWRRRNPRLSATIGVGASVLTLGLLLVIGLWPARGLLLMGHFASNAVLFPYFGLIGVLYADQIPSAGGGIGGPMPSPEMIQVYTYLLVQITYLLAAMLFWLMATQSFRMGRRR
jgi:ABC-type transport system involved in multi-copper enzyme maturation permease subunit